LASDAQPADRDLIARALSGDQRAFAVLVQRYGRAVYARLSRAVRYPVDAEDLLQEVLRLTGDTPVWTFSTSIPAQIETDGPEEVFRIGVNHTYLRDMIHALGLDPDEALELRFIDPLKAILFLPVRHTDRKGLLMPLRMRKD